MKSIKIIISLILVANFAFAQDVITKRNNEKLTVKITEIGTDEVKYKSMDANDDIIYVLDKTDVLSINFKSGKVENVEKNFLTPVSLAEQRKQAIKLNFISPAMGYTKLGYEKYLKPGQSLDFSMNIIGLGSKILTEEAAPRGVGMTFAYKFIKQPNYYNKGMRLQHCMQGMYLAPSLNLGTYNRTVNHFNWDSYDGIESTPERGTVSYASAMLYFGNQSVIQNRFVIDFNIGLGIGKSSGIASTWDSGRHFGMQDWGRSGIFTTSNLKIGYLF